MLASPMTTGLWPGQWTYIMNISKTERRALEMLSFGGCITVEKDGKQVVDVYFITREGWFLDGYGLREFDRLRQKKMIASQAGGPYRITKSGVAALSLARKS